MGCWCVGCVAREVLRAHDLKFTHKSVASKFRDGRSFEALMQDLRSSEFDPTVGLEPLKVFHWEFVLPPGEPQIYPELVIRFPCNSTGHESSRC